MIRIHLMLTQQQSRKVNCYSANHWRTNSRVSHQ